MKKIFATLMVLATMAIALPLAADAQTYTTRRVYRNGRYQTVRVYTTRTTNRNYGYNRNNNNGQISARERLRLARERNRLSRTANRVTRDGVVTSREAHRLNRQGTKYVRRVNRARNN